MQIKPVILCGGSGSRLWPLSRQHYPKQLISFDGESSLLQQTARRAMAAASGQAIHFVCNEDYRFLVAEQLRGVAGLEAEILLEPAARNTAAAIALSAFQLVQDDPVMLVMPSDHLIADIDAFCQATTAAAMLADAGYVVTFGVPASRPETGYGYIRQGDAVSGGHKVAAFVEKPDVATANDYVTSGDYLWNAGAFAFKASVYLEELKKFEPEVYGVCSDAVSQLSTDLDFRRVPASIFALCPAISVDYAVMERTDKAAVVPLEAGWTDIGSFDALKSAMPEDQSGNVVSGDVLVRDTQDSLVFSTSRLVTTLGIESLVVVETPDAVLVADKNKSQDVKQIVETLRESGRGESDLHQRVYRPWGFYESIEASERYQVKLIEVSPGASLSLQKHHHRAEHWVVVSGTARVTCDDNVFQLSENESTFIPIGSTHRLENPGRIPLRIIEVQSGSYLGEDDIVRFEDKYGRDEQGR